ncbi:MAG: UxaA family hydrolase [Chloroflexi bacterium]|nr:UxaA family hydrolase [Chloroflexota bacterium]
MGYRRISGNVGVRNHVLIFPTVTCAATVAQMISREVPGTVCVTHQHGCGHLGEEKDHMIRVMSGFCANPNVAGVLLVGLGCELITPEVLIEHLRKTRQQVESLSIQNLGGTTKAVEKGIELARKLLSEAAETRREEVDLSGLIVGTHCGGSDTMSGLTANPALGIACDLLVAESGTVILSETPEMLGTEHILAKRAANDSVRRHIFEITEATEKRLKSTGADIRGTEPSPGNIAGGLSTLEEKSLGAIRKGGTSPINEVIEFAQKPSQKGLVIMDGPAHDIISNTGMIAAGAQLIAFTTGRGTPIGSPIAPVTKISSNSTLYNCMQDNIDINAGTILDGEGMIEGIGEEIFKELIEVASGKLTRAELLGHCEFAIHSIGPTV